MAESTVIQELSSRTFSLRCKLSAVQQAVSSSGRALQTQSEKLLQLARAADRHAEATQSDRRTVATAELDLRELEDRRAFLQLQEGERHRAADLERAYLDTELAMLLQQAEEAERLGCQFEVEAAAALPALKAQVAAEERALAESTRLQSQEYQSLACSWDPAHAVAIAKELCCYERCRMLLEDKPFEALVAAVDDEKDVLQRKFHRLLAPAAFDFTSEEHIAADVWTGTLATGNRAFQGSCHQCLEHLSLEGPWRLVFSEIHEVYELIAQMRRQSDDMAASFSGSYKVFLREPSKGLLSEAQGSKELNHRRKDWVTFDLAFNEMPSHMAMESGSWMGAGNMQTSESRQADLLISSSEWTGAAVDNDAVPVDYLSNPTNSWADDMQVHIPKSTTFDRFCTQEPPEN
eukprot:TRINITY_DN95850_c0_g1_i1.p1 TRINITY_DN95850_c0_g1~~TRINITY_DN95850_c0_g1_i1.p1  ORF type:complete len:406 (-),score=81.74 TRINITY_DN95850_c0_g1_i1:169-1386(-)